MEAEGIGTVSIPAPGDGAENGVGGAAPSPQSREAPGYEARSEGEARPRGGRVFLDFGGGGKIYALTEGVENVETFNSLEEVSEKLCPDTIVIDSLPGKFQKAAAELAKTGVTFLRLKSLGKLSEERKKNGVKKTNENDVKLLRELFKRHPDLFQPLSTAPEELEVRALTELWVELARQRKAAKRARTITEDPVATEVHKTLTRLTDVLEKRIHEKAMALPLYRRAVEELGIKGPCLAYIISHDSWALTNLPRDKLAVRYSMTDRHYRRRPLRSRLLILLGKAAVLHRHTRYDKIYDEYRRRRKKRWEAILRVAMRLLRDLRRLGRQTQTAGPPA
mgnify:CR=1 FL=1